TIAPLTDELDCCSLLDLQPGTYPAVIKVPGVATGALRELVATTGGIAPGTLTSKLGAVEEWIQIRTSAVAIDADRHVVATVVTEEQIHSLPLTSRNSLDLSARGVIVNSGASLEPTKVQGYRPIGISGRSGARPQVLSDAPVG